MQLKKFQEEAVDDLISKSKKLLRYNGKKISFSNHQQVQEKQL